MAWIITKDIINNGENEGEWNSIKEMTEVQCKKICKYKFKLLDDDFEVYFEGLSSDNSSFFALDYFGSMYGCTMIEYYENGKWVAL